MSSAIKTPAFLAKAGNIQNEDGSSIYSNGDWSLKNSTAVASVTIKDDGSVGIGTDSPGASFHVKRSVDGNVWKTEGPTANLSYQEFSNFTYLWNQGSPLLFGTSSNHTLLLGTNNAERMRIDGNGNVLVGTTVSNGTFTTTSNGNTYSIYSNGGAAGYNIACRATTTNSTAIRFLNSGGSAIGSITTTATSTSYNPSSDARLKENIEPLSNALETVKKLQPRKYTWKVDGSSDDGFIAQELQQIPEFAHRVNPIGEHDGEMYYGVDYMRFVTYLTAAVQELSAKNEALEARLAALEAK